MATGSQSRDLEQNVSVDSISKSGHPSKHDHEPRSQVRTCY
jgi:hypothetical protein